MYKRQGKLYPDAEYLPCSDFPKVIDTLKNQQADLAILPIENSTSSNVHDSVDLVINNQLQIVAETFLPINFDLIGLKTSKLTEIKRVIIHPQAAKQCLKILDASDYEILTANSNTQAQHAVLEKNDPTLAAISTSDLISDQLETFIKDVNDHQHNFTRFIAVSLNNPQRLVTLQKYLPY